MSTAKKPTPDAEPVALPNKQAEVIGALKKPDANSPAALKAAQEKKPETGIYEVLKPQIIDGEWKSPASKGAEPVTVELPIIATAIKVAQGKLRRVDETGKAG